MRTRTSWQLRPLFLAVGALAGFISLLAQEPPKPDQEDLLIRTDVNVIVLHATVKDGRNRFVRGLAGA